MDDVTPLLERVAAGEAANTLEGETIDFKTVDRSVPDALVDLAEASACFANANGGMIVVGVKDRVPGTDAFVGSPLDCTATVNRIYEVTEPSLIVIARPLTFRGSTLTIITVPPSPDVHLVRGIARERVGDACRPMSPQRIATVLQDRRGEDWSGKDSGIPLEDVSPLAVEIAREMLRQAADEERRSWAALPWPDVCRRLGAVSGENLTNGGRMLFRDEQTVHVRYVRRTRASGLLSANEQITGSGLWAIRRTLEFIEAQVTRTAIVLPGGSQLLIGDLPEGALREAVVNAFMHRDHRDPSPIQIEHGDGRLRLTSPGGFAPGVTIENVLTVSSRSRNPSLVQAIRGLGLGEAAGVGVDRMYAAMTSVGHQPPVFMTDGDTVEITLEGGPPNEPVTRFVAALPEDQREDPDALLVMTFLLTHRTVTARRIAPILQKTDRETESILMRLSAPGDALLERTADSARSRQGEYRLVGPAVRALGAAVTYRRRSGDDTDRKVVEIVREAGQINGRMVQTMFDVKPATASRILSDLVDRRILVKTSTATRGPSVTYGPGDRFPTSRSQRSSRRSDAGNQEELEFE
ncbi:ATP-binding protein [Brachybacterium sp. YJGR34]|uniref:ATP-binding protein n=1 Tax=Brachybacterium sp. YJGR34 TaxID=2059911 RepID=UPI0018E60F93|nr:ATP-binding protein [Brachybacterium sp. YJGR34]